MEKKSVVVTFVDGTSFCFYEEDALNMVRAYLWYMKGRVSFVYTSRTEPLLDVDTVSMIEWDKVMSWKIYGVGSEELMALSDEIDRLSEEFYLGSAVFAPSGFVGAKKGNISMNTRGHSEELLDELSEPQLSLLKKSDEVQKFF